MKNRAFQRFASCVATAGLALAVSPLSAIAQPAYNFVYEGEPTDYYYVESAYDGDDSGKGADMVEAPDGAFFGLACFDCGEIVWFDEEQNALIDSHGAPMYLDHYFGCITDQNDSIVAVALNSVCGYLIPAAGDGDNDVYLTEPFLASDACTDELMEKAFSHAQLEQLVEDIQNCKFYLTPYGVNAAMMIANQDKTLFFSYDTDTAATLLAHGQHWSLDEETGEVFADGGELLAAPMEITPCAHESESGMAGGWTINGTAAEDPLPADAVAAFDAAMEGMTGVGYKPVALLGTQVVAGTNYAFLCLGTTVTASPETGLYVVTIYQDLQGNASVLNVEKLDIAAFSR